jgi:ATP-dependent DNA helicase DinG
VLTDLSRTAQRLLAGSAADVAWVERDDRGRRALVVAPLSVAGMLTEHLYAERTVVATSATLALGGRFDTVARALGLPDKPGDTARDKAAGGNKEEDEEDEEEGEELRWQALDVGSPFDYPKQGILYVAAHLPRPTTSGLADPAADELVSLVTALGGRTLGLFSSRRAAERAAEILRAKTDLTILLQGEEALPLLVRRFRDERSSCLLGVMSLWQGVDVPGDACQLVVIDRLPFPRPDEPLAAARAAAVDTAGGSGFAAVSVPIAAVRLAQGVGRLIRSRTDKGVVAVLDSRLETARGYGEFLRKSLPPFWYTTKPELVRGALTRLASGAQS